MDPATLIARIIAHADGLGAGNEPVGTAVPGFGFVRARAPTDILPMTYRPIFCLVLQGAKCAVIGSRTLRFAAGESLIVGLDLPAASHIVQASAAAPYVALSLEIDRGLLRELAAPLSSRAADPAPAPAAATLPGDDEIRDAMARLFALVARPQAIPVLAPLIVREIHYWLLTSGHGAMLRGLVQADGQGGRIARAVDLIRRDFDQPLAVASLARVAAMSPSTFHAHFRAVTGLSPLQFQKRLRLVEARRQMLEGGASVSGAAFAVGYESPTQFSRDYARLFGAPPRREVVAARALPQAAAAG